MAFGFAGGLAEGIAPIAGHLEQRRILGQKQEREDAEKQQKKTTASLAAKRKGVDEAIAAFASAVELGGGERTARMADQIRATVTALAAEAETLGQPPAVDPGVVDQQLQNIVEKGSSVDQAVRGAEGEVAEQKTRVQGLIDQGTDPVEALRIILGTEKPIAKRASEAGTIAEAQRAPEKPLATRVAEKRALAEAARAPDKPGFKTQNFQLPGDPSSLITVDTSTAEGRAKANELLARDFVSVPISVQASPLEGAGLSGKTTSATEGQFISLEDEEELLESIARGFDPRFQTLPGELAAQGANAFERLGGTLSAENKALFEQFVTFKRDSFDLMNATIKRITGAQMSEPEAKRIRKQLPDPAKDGPTAYMAKLRAVQQRVKMLKVRRSLLLQNGIQHDFQANVGDEAPITLEQAEQRFQQRGEEIADALQASNPGMSDDEAFAQAAAQLRAEFNI